MAYKLLRWGFILFNLLMLVTLVSYLGQAKESVEGAATQLGAKWRAAGWQRGLVPGLTFWIVVNVILSICLMLMRRKS